MNQWRLGHRPALDGLRGLAILLVLVAHFDNHYGDPLTAAGESGVLVFFTLSGFLITALLLGERSRTGRVSMASFYRRRVFRLMPALLAVLVFVAVLELLGKSLNVPGPMFAAVAFDVSNIWQIHNPGTGALSHTWSLSIEEQFYLIWPVVLIFATARWRRLGLSRVAVGGIAVSVISMLLPSHSLDRGSLEHAAAILAGCLLAILMTSRSEGRTRPWVAFAAVAAICAMSPFFEELHPIAYLLGVPALTVVALWATAQGDGVRWLSGPILRWFGRRSYGIYLWHYPIIWAVGVKSQHPWAFPVTLIPMVLIAAELSWWLIECPAQRLGRRLGSRNTGDAAQELERADRLGRGTEGTGHEADVRGCHGLGKVAALEPRNAVG